MGQIQIKKIGSAAAKRLKKAPAAIILCMQE